MKKTQIFSYPVGLGIRGADKVLLYLNEISMYDKESPSKRYLIEGCDGFTKAEIARQTGFDRRTVRSILAKLENNKVLLPTEEKDFFHPESQKIILDGKVLGHFSLYSMPTSDRKYLFSHLPVDAMDVFFYLLMKYNRYTKFAHSRTTFSLNEIQSYLTKSADGKRKGSRGSASQDKAKTILSSLFSLELIDLKVVEIKGNPYYQIKNIGLNIGSVKDPNKFTALRLTPPSKKS